MTGFPDKVFEQKVKEGHRYQCIVASWLIHKGYKAVSAPYEVTHDPEEMKRFKGVSDITIDLKGHTYFLEVKSENREFNNDPKSYPHPWAFVEEVHLWDSKLLSPLGTVLISTETEAAVYISTSTKKHWDRIPYFNREAGTERIVYACPRRLLLPYTELYKELGESHDKLDLDAMP